MIRLEFKFQELSYREVSIQEQTRILISKTSWNFLSRGQSGSFYFKNILEFYFMNSLSTCSRTDRIYYAPNFEKVGDILFSACPCVCVCVCVYGASRYHLDTSCMDSS